MTRQELAEAVQRRADLSKAEAVALVGQALAQICDCLAAKKSVKLSGFGRFEVRLKGQGVGRNPKTKEAIPIEPRQVVLFRPSPVLRRRINGQNVNAGTETG